MVGRGCVQEELGHLRKLWDTVAAVLGTFGEWYRTLWDVIVVDELLERTKGLAKDVKALPKAVRLYDVFRCGAQASCAGRPSHSLG